MCWQLCAPQPIVLWKIKRTSDRLNSSSADSTQDGGTISTKPDKWWVDCFSPSPAAISPVHEGSIPVFFHDCWVRSLTEQPADICSPQVGNEESNRGRYVPVFVSILSASGTATRVLDTVAIAG